MKIIKLTNVLALAMLGSIGIQAAQTNLVQTLHIELSAYTQGPVVTNGFVISSSLNTTRISNQDIIEALGSATTNSFSRDAHLLLMKSLPDGDLKVVIRDGTNSVAVTRFFSADHADTKAIRGRINLLTGIASGSEYSFHNFALTDDTNAQPLTIHFELSGLTRATFISLLNGKGRPFGTAYEYGAIMSGTGDVNGTNALFEGAISGKGRKIEIVP